MKKLLLTALCLTAVSAYAAEPTAQSLERLLEVQQFDKIIDQTFGQMAASASSNPAIQQKLQNVPADKRAAVQKRLQQYFNEQFGFFRSPAVRAEIRQSTIEGFRKVYTQEEVDAMIKFYGSPVGKSIIAKMPKYTEVTLASLNASMAKHVRQNTDAETKLNRDINTIICGKAQCDKPKGK